MEITKLDKNFAKSEPQTKLSMKNLHDTAAVIYGLYGENFCRIPEKYAKTMRKDVQMLQTNTSCGSFAFCTSSLKVAVEIQVKNLCQMPHMTLVGSAGIDLFSNGKHIASAWPDDNGLIKFQGELPDEDKEIIVYLPLYSGVKEIYIGVSDSEQILPPKTVYIHAPIVFYGSSITQGGCASRPSNNYCALLARSVGYDVYNLGFSGNALGEPEMAEYISTLPMSCFVMDYDHNAPSCEHLEKTHLPFLQQILIAQPEVPVIVISRPNDTLSEDACARRKIIYETYTIIQRHKKNIWFIDGDSLFKDDFRDLSTVDTCHPNDLGFYMMYEVVLPILKNALEI